MISVYSGHHLQSNTMCFISCYWRVKCDRPREKRYKSAKGFSRFHRIPRCLPFLYARSKFGADSLFNSGDIAAFVPGSRALEN